MRGFLLVFAPLSFALFLSLFGTGALFFSALNLRALTFLFLSPLSLGALILTGSLASIYSTSAFTLKYSLEGRSPELYVFTFSETTEEIAVRRYSGQNTIKLDLTVSLSDFFFFRKTKTCLLLFFSLPLREKTHTLA